MFLGRHIRSTNAGLHHLILFLDDHTDLCSMLFRQFGHWKKRNSSKCHLQFELAKAIDSISKNDDNICGANISTDHHICRRLIHIVFTKISVGKKMFSLKKKQFVVIFSFVFFPDCSFSLFTVCTCEKCSKNIKTVLLSLKLDYKRPYILLNLIFLLI